jgi:uncharacterized protein YprB with RNaseH-like and TPR domain
VAYTRRKLNRGACDVCEEPIFSTRPNVKMHPSCRGEFQRRKTDQDQIDQIINKRSGPMGMQPQGRPWNDPRNNARLNKSRIEFPDELKGMSPIRVCVYDLETTDLNAQTGRLLTATIMGFDPDEMFMLTLRDYDAWKTGKRSDDSEIVADTLAILEQFDVHIAHNGCNFDRKFIYTRALAHGLPPVQPQKTLDPCLLARQNFALKSNRLDSVGDHLHVDVEKTPFVSEIWVKAFMDGDVDAMKYIEDHNVKDVVGLAKIARKLAPWVKQLDMIGSFRR